MYNPMRVEDLKIVNLLKIVLCLFKIHINKLILEDRVVYM